jgi:hypothetical protein
LVYRLACDHRAEEVLSLPIPPVELHARNTSVVVAINLDWYLEAVDIELNLFRLRFRVEACCEEIRAAYTVETFAFNREFYRKFSRERVDDLAPLGPCKNEWGGATCMY